MNLPSYDLIEAQDAAQFLQDNSDMLILDVRTREEWDEGHIPHARHISIQELPERWQELPDDRGIGIVCICAVGGRSAAACEFLAAQGYTRLVNVVGGMMGYTGETTM